MMHRKHDAALLKAAALTLVLGIALGHCSAHASVVDRIRADVADDLKQGRAAFCAKYPKACETQPRSQHEQR